MWGGSRHSSLRWKQIQAAFTLKSASGYNQQEKLTTYFKNRNALHLTSSSGAIPGSRNTLFLPWTETPVPRLRSLTHFSDSHMSCKTCFSALSAVLSVDDCSSQSQCLWYLKCIIFHIMHDSPWRPWESQSLLLGGHAS